MRKEEDEGKEVYLEYIDNGFSEMGRDNSLSYRVHAPSDAFGEELSNLLRVTE